MSEEKIPSGGQPVLYEVNNTDEQIMIRKYQNTLVIVGMGIMLFAAWTTVRTFADLILKKPLILNFMNAVQAGEPELLSESLVYGVFCAVTIIILFTGILIRVIVGRAAIAEGRGRRSAGRLFLFLTVILILSGIFSTVNEAITLFVRSEDELRIHDVSLVSVFIELTSLFMLADMFVSFLKLRHMRKQGQTGRR